MTMVLLPSELLEVISLIPAIWPKRRSSGAATVAAMVSGPAPGWLTEVKMIGSSIFGSGATGR